MLEPTVLAICTRLGLSHRPPTAQGWLHVTCPFATWEHRSGEDKNPSMGVLLGPSVSRWYCFSCGFSGEFTHVVRRLSQYQPHLDMRDLYQIAVDEEADRQFALWSASKKIAPYAVPESFLDGFPAADTRVPARTYLTVRGVTAALMTAWDLRFDPVMQRVCVPVRDFSGVLRGVQGRSLKTTPGGGPKYWHYFVEGGMEPQNHLYWLGEHRIHDHNIPLVLVEGLFDAIAVSKFHPNVLAAFGTTVITAKLPRIAFADRIVTLFDSDESGHAARQKVATWAKGRAALRHIVLPEGQDAASAHPDALRAHLDSALSALL